MADKLQIKFDNSNLKKVYKKTYNKIVPINNNFIRIFSKIVYLILRLIKPLPAKFNGTVHIFSDPGDNGGGFFWAWKDQRSGKLFIDDKSLSNFNLPRDLQVDRHLPPELHRSSMIRELFVLQTGFKHFYSCHKHFKGYVIFYSDNLGVVCDAITGKFPNEKCGKI